MRAAAESQALVVFQVASTEDEQRVVNAVRDSHPEALVRRKMLVVWLLHCGLTRTKTAEIAGLSRPTVQRYVVASSPCGLDGLRRWGVRGPVSDLVAHTTVIREAFTDRPVRTAAEAAEQIERLTGLKRQLVAITNTTVVNTETMHTRIAGRVQPLSLPPPKASRRGVAAPLRGRSICSPPVFS